MKKIAVIGTGGTGYTVAAELSMRGHKVWLCSTGMEENPIKSTEYSKTMELTGAVQGSAVIHAVTNDIQTALADVELVICCTVSNWDEDVARIIAPYIMPGSKVLLSAGNLGSLIYYRVFKECAAENIIVGETSGNLFSCRRPDENTVLIGNAYGPKDAAAFPARNTPCLIEAFKDVYELTPSSCILEAAFSAPNLLSHISLTLVNAGAIENSKEPYYIFKQGICRSTINLADGLWKEKKAVMDALGFHCAPSPSNSFRKYANQDIHEFDHFKDLEGPDSLTVRHITEDIPILGCLFLSVARAVGVETPLYASMVKVAEAINQTNYYEQGRTTENLGIGHLRGIQIPQYFQQAD